MKLIEMFKQLDLVAEDADEPNFCCLLERDGTYINCGVTSCFNCPLTGDHTWADVLKKELRHAVNHTPTASHQGY